VINVIGHKVKSPCTQMVQLYLPGDINVHLHWIHASLRPPESTSQTTSRPVQPFLQGSSLWETDQPTEHATLSVTTGRIYVVLWCSLIIILKSHILSIIAA